MLSPAWLFGGAPRAVPETTMCNQPSAEIYLGAAVFVSLICSILFPNNHGQHQKTTGHLCPRCAAGIFPACAGRTSPSSPSSRDKDHRAVRVSRATRSPLPPRRPRPKHSTVLAADTSLPWTQKLTALGRAALTGRIPPQMVEKRLREDRELGLIRLTDSTYRKEVLEGDPNILWVMLISDDKADKGLGLNFVQSFRNATKLFKETSPLGGLGVERTGRRVAWAVMDYQLEWQTSHRLNVYK